MTADPSTHILLIEDDAKVALSLRKGLLEAGFVITTARTAADADTLLTEQSFQLVLLDLGLPDRDGIDLLRQWRDQGARTPVLILTARDAVDDRVRGLDTGADDYLAKPFAFNELLARIRALCRRSGRNPENILSVGPLRIDLLNRRVQRGENELELTPREFDVLAYLASQAGATVSRDTLTRDVWNIQRRSSSMDNVIDVLIARLREKLEKGFDQPLLHTIRGVGYKLKADT